MKLRKVFSLTYADIMEENLENRSGQGGRRWFGSHLHSGKPAAPHFKMFLNIRLAFVSDRSLCLVFNYGMVYEYTITISLWDRDTIMITYIQEQLLLTRMAASGNSSYLVVEIIRKCEGRLNQYPVGKGICSYPLNIYSLPLSDYPCM